MKKKHRMAQSLREQFREIFDYPNAPILIWEQEFDYCTDKLHAMAKKPWTEITRNELSFYYISNLAFHHDLQKELFDYLFPLCVADWLESLMADQPSCFGDDIHYAFSRDLIWHRMMSIQQRNAIFELICQCVINRLSAEDSFLFLYRRTPAYAWFDNLLELSNCLPLTEKIWESWWAVDNRGKAISALMWISCWVFDEEENPIFRPQHPKLGGGNLCLDLPKLPVNRDYFINCITPVRIDEVAQKAAAQLSGAREEEIANYIAKMAHVSHEIIQIRMDDFWACHD